MTITVVAPLSRSSIALANNNQKVKVTQWGAPLSAAKHVVFYFGGLPASAEEPALHSAESDVYEERGIHLVCIDKPGMGGSTFQYNFSLRNDWPQIVDHVANHLNLHDKYGVIGISNGGPYVMATLIHPDYRHRVKAAAMIVGVSDNVWRSGYFSWRTPSTIFEGLYNSLPLVLTAPFNAMALYAGDFYMTRLGGFEKLFPTLPAEAKPVLSTLFKDGAKTCGLAASMDCQQGLSLAYATSSKADYSNVSQNVSMWYGLRDGTVPMASAQWLHDQLPQSQLHKVDGNHFLYGDFKEKILDELVRHMDAADEVTADASNSEQ